MNREQAQEIVRQHDRFNSNIEAMRAFANGQKVQYFSQSRNAWVDTSDPLFSSHDTYRVKPKAIEGWVNVYVGERVGPVYPTIAQADAAAGEHRVRRVFVREVEGK